ncbi:MAG TPA: response regulator [Albitalea sp.]|uniref:hybrid sensor histidine kinase/response regulator n=1 Tax=Piscinibacter sp. TaxID=1903157 RepID=UPI002ED205BE
MTREDERFLRQLRATFQVEAQEHLAAMSYLLLALERAPQGPDATRAVESLFREAHSLKGAARSVNLADIEQMCQALERVLAAAKRGELAPSPAFFDGLNQALDAVTLRLAQSADDGVRDPHAVVATVRALDVLLTGAPDIAAPPAITTVDLPPALPETPAAPGADTVRVATAKLEALMTQAEELQAYKVHGRHLADEARALAGALADWKRQLDRIGGSARALTRAASRPGRGNGRRELAQLVDASQRNEGQVRTLLDCAHQLERAADRDSRGLGQRVDRLQADMRQALMLPFSTLLAGLPKLVRDLAQASGKDVELVTSGAAIEVDRRMLEGLKTPLTHLVRNAVDHGIEAPGERQRRGKPARGRITIEVAARPGNQVELLLADDGTGIAVDRVRERALRMGLADASELERMAPEQVADLVFASGLSTSPILTDLSGHGLGLAIVREKVEALSGSVELLSPAGGAGTRFCIRLPTTLATFRGLLVAAADRLFVLPSRSVDRVGRVPRSAIRDGKAGDTVEHGGETLPVVALADALGLAPAASHAVPAHRQLVVVESGDKRIAFVVDDVLEDLEVLVKPLAPPLRRVRNIAGATVLGTGRVVPLLNVADLVKTALLRGKRRRAPPAIAPGGPRASLLVAEDSITSRERLKAILEAAGYRVTTAVDGMAALATLQSGEFDLLVSDVEMPRLDGFDLTARVRGDKRLAGLPVVLVTALDSRADQQRGIEVGANAYIAKSGFDQRRLLDAIRTLL